MEIVLYIIVSYLVFAIISRIFAKRTKAKMLNLKAHTVEVNVGDTVIPESEWATFNKSDYTGQIIKYTIAYNHPINPNEETTYDLYEVVKESRFIHNPEIPLNKEFDVTVHAQKRHKIIIGQEHSLKSQIDKKMEELEKKKDR